MICNRFEMDILEPLNHGCFNNADAHIIDIKILRPKVDFSRTNSQNANLFNKYTRGIIEMLTQFKHHKESEQESSPAKAPAPYSMFEALKQTHGQSVVLNETAESRRLYVRISTNYSDDVGTNIEPNFDLSHAKKTKPSQ